MTTMLNPFIVLMCVFFFALIGIPYLQQSAKIRNLQKQYVAHKFLETEWEPFYRFQLLYLKKSIKLSRPSKTLYYERSAEVFIGILRLNDYHNGKKEITTTQVDLLNQLSKYVAASEKGKAKEDNYIMAMGVYTQLEETFKNEGKLDK